MLQPTSLNTLLVSLIPNKSCRANRAGELPIVVSSGVALWNRVLDLLPRLTALLVSSRGSSSADVASLLAEEVLLEEALIDELGVLDAGWEPSALLDGEGVLVLTTDTDVYQFVVNFSFTPEDAVASDLEATPSSELVVDLREVADIALLVGAIGEADSQGLRLAEPQEEEYAETCNQWFLSVHVLNSYVYFYFVFNVFLLYAANLLCFSE